MQKGDTRGQLLRLPVDEAIVTAGYKNPAYKDRFRFTHYGCDYYDPAGIVRSPGMGKVLAAGTDSIYGGIIALRMPRAIIPRTGQVLDLAIRMYHLDRVDVAAGDDLLPGMPLGLLGGTGRISTGPHLHVEVSLDARGYAKVPGLCGRSTYFEAGEDRTLNPAWVFTRAPGQTLRRQDDIYSEMGDIRIPSIFSAVRKKRPSA